MKRTELLRHLRAHGCVFIREGASHSWWGNPEQNRHSSVPRHTEINDNLARKICKDLGARSRSRAEDDRPPIVRRR